MVSLVCSVVYSFNTLVGTWKHSACTIQSDHMKPLVKSQRDASGPCSTGRSYRMLELNLPDNQKEQQLYISNPTMDV